ncbi:Gldg family protein [Flavobacteriaceae bacterium]|nr:Gldg family protein [Flavobacteriaceae bacterium]
MNPIIKQTFSSFFAQAAALLLMGVFVLGVGVYFWVLPGDQNLFDAGFGDLTQVFRVLPWGVLLVVSALSMRLFSPERQSGTLALLLTRPVSLWSVVLGKYLGAMGVLGLLLLSTLCYPLTLEYLITGPYAFDWGIYWSGLSGLLLLGGFWMTLGLLCSILTSNALVAFMLTLLLGAGSFMVPGQNGLEGIYLEFTAGLWSGAGSLYLLSLGFILLLLSRYFLGRYGGNKQPWHGLLKPVFGGLLIAFLGLNNLPKWDLTQDRRFTLSEPTRDVLAGLDQPIFVDVLLAGDLPQSFQRLTQETQTLLNRYALENEFLISTLDPTQMAGTDPQLLDQLAEFGIQSSQVTVKRNARQESVLLYPYALVTYGGRTVSVPLLKNTLGAEMQERITESVRHLEYAFTDALIQLSRPKLKKIAIMRGNEEASDQNLTGFIEAIKPYYFVGAFTLDSVAKNPTGTLEALKGYDLIVLADPKEAFTPEEKLVLDQFIMSGGRSLWLVDGARVPELDESGQTLAMGQSLELTDLFFAYGLRINPNLVLDVFSAPITLATGEVAGAYTQFPWWFSPMAQDSGIHPIMAHVDGVKLDYVSSIDTLPSGPKKTVLLQSSPRSKILGLPYVIDLNREIDTQIQMIQEAGADNTDSSRNDLKSDQPFGLAAFNQNALPMAVLLEGNFKSAFANRVLPFDLKNPSKESPSNKMVVIADGAVIQNKVQRGQALPLGYDSWTKAQFGNKEFLLNTVNYLLGDSGLINIRNKQINVPFLDPERTAQGRSGFLALNLVLPLLIIGIFGGLLQWFRHRQYAR